MLRALLSHDGVASVLLAHDASRAAEMLQLALLLARYGARRGAARGARRHGEVPHPFIPTPLPLPLPLQRTNKPEP